MKSWFKPAASPKDEKRLSLESFKAKAASTVVAETLDKITGGRLSNCHTGGMS